MTNQKAPERAPLLSDAALEKRADYDNLAGVVGSMKSVRAFYEDLITRGELVVRDCVGQVVCTNNGDKLNFRCYLKTGGSVFTKDRDISKCPGCGLSIRMTE